MEQRRKNDNRDNHGRRDDRDFRGSRSPRDGRDERGSRNFAGSRGFKDSPEGGRSFQGNSGERSKSDGRNSRGAQPSRGVARGSAVSERRFSNRCAAPDKRNAPERSLSAEGRKALLKRYGAERKNFSVSPVSDDLCWGRNPVLTLLENKPSLCRQVTLLAGAQDDFREKIVGLCAGHDIPLEIVSRDDLDAMTGGSAHQGVAARMSPMTPVDLDDVIEGLDAQAPALMVLMDHCQDPHNLGAVIRTAEIAGAACVICQNDRSATVNGTVVKTSAGAVFRLPVAQVVNVNRALERLKAKNFWIVGLDHNTDETVWTSPLPERMVLVVGSEGEGISSLVSKNCDKLVKFPMAGTTGNLNASVAAALGMFEWVRLYGCGEACAEQ